MTELWWVFVLGGVLVGAIAAWLGLRLRRHHVVAQAEEQAHEWVTNAEEKLRTIEAELKDRMDEMREESMERFEKETFKHVQRNQELADKIEEREDQLKDKLQTQEQARNRQEQIFKSRQGRLQSREGQVRGVTEKRDQLVKTYRAALESRSQADLEKMRQEILAQLEIEASRHATKQALAMEEENDVNLERDAKRVLHIALNRFPRPYCAERGIGNVEFPSPEIKERTLGPERKLLKALEKTCGVDISINDEYQSASVLGYDPVRRELGRLSLEKLVADRNPSEARIPEIVQNCKKELFKKIINDGNRIARELRLDGFSEEIRHMMGALRYRYSFAQNQHFHCAEVGWLCGLLSSELGVEVKDGRRAGLLHDIGKAMDHSKEGGHAVIGAEFIEQHGEKPHIVHAVRAHHFDETPATDLAYLVIAADAISGARPGARRSTVDSYTQKIADLEKISSSFDGVIATYILSAGREVRVIVDSHRIDDHKALELSKQIARKIEEEASYPGLIKLTVVRETQAIEMAK
ncbi:MAG: Rnase Y domain-containing protein [Bdellovibrionales bacterium]